VSLKNAIPAIRHRSGKKKGHMAENVKLICLMGYAAAKDHGQIKEGIELCSRAIRQNPELLDNYLYLGRLYLMSGEKDLAIKAFRSGLKVKKDNRIIAELINLGIRRPPPFDSLPRDHKLNIAAGRLLKFLGMR